MGVTAQQIDAAMLAITALNPEWPPTVQEFRKICLPAVDHSQDWKSQRADRRKFPSAARLEWHKANIAWVKAGNELPRPGVREPPAPTGCADFWSIYSAPDA